MSEIITSGEMRDLWADIKNNTEQLDIDLSALRDSITASGENATTLNNLYNKIEETRVLLNNIAAEDFATESTLDEIRNYIYSLLQQTATEDKQDALIAKDFATQTTLAAILAKIIEAPATEAKQTALAALIGEVQASPTANTLLARLKSLEDKIGTIDGVLDAIVDGSAPAATQLTGSIPESKLFIVCHEVKVTIPPGHLTTFAEVSVPSGETLVISEMDVGSCRTIDHSVSTVCTVSIDANLSSDLYGGVYSRCLNLGSPFRMLFNSKCQGSNGRVINFVRGFPLYGGGDGSTYYFKLKNEDPMHAMTGTFVILGEWR